jgi:hypothetical protein
MNGASSWCRVARASYVTGGKTSIPNWVESPLIRPGQNFQSKGIVMTAKAIAFQILQELPDDVSMADVIEELELRLAIDEGLRQLDDGQGIPHEQVKERFAQWLK